MFCSEAAAQKPTAGVFTDMPRLEAAVSILIHTTELLEHGVRYGVSPSLLPLRLRLRTAVTVDTREAVSKSIGSEPVLGAKGVERVARKSEPTRGNVGLRRRRHVEEQPRRVVSHVHRHLRACEIETLGDLGVREGLALILDDVDAIRRSPRFHDPIHLPPRIGWEPVSFGRVRGRA